MKLRTILFFGILALAFSLPMLGPGNLTTSQKQGSFQPIPTTLDAYGNAVAQQPRPTKGLLARLFGDSSQSNEASPVSSTGVTHLSNATGAATSFGNFANQTAPSNLAGFVSQPLFSEPVYTAFFGLGEFLRFDVSPSWIRSKWPRVSMIQGDDRLTGMRVALVSGPRPGDIHGSLTYFFDNQQRVQRICFKGWTGDAGEITQLVQQMGFTRQKSNAAGYYTKQSWGTPKGALRLDYPPVIRREMETEQLMVLFEFINPKSNLAVSAATQSILNAMESGR